MRKGDTTRAVATMETAGLDLGDRWSHVCILDGDARVVLEQRIATTAVGLEAFFGTRPRLRLALEAGTHSPWVSRWLQRLGHEVLVANPRRLRSISTHRFGIAASASSSTSP